MAEVNTVLSESEWIIDSGASDHITYDLSSFHSFTEFNQPKTVILGDRGKLEALGRGEIHVYARVGEIDRLISLSNVLYVPGMRRKLISATIAQVLFQLEGLYCVMMRASLCLLE